MEAEAITRVYVHRGCCEREGETLVVRWRIRDGVYYPEEPFCAASGMALHMVDRVPQLGAGGADGVLHTR